MWPPKFAGDEREVGRDVEHAGVEVTHQAVPAVRRAAAHTGRA